MKLTDPTYTKAETLGPIDRLFCKLIRDPRDLPFIRLATLLTLIFPPAAIALFVPGWLQWYTALPYLVVMAILSGPYILMLHNTSHRKLFKREYSILSHWIPTFLGPFFGETPESYYIHHVAMHHPENNLPDDLSSTMRYDRQSFLGFLHYFFHFMVFGSVELIRYMARRNRQRLSRRLMVGEYGYFLFLLGLAWFNWQATLTVFVFPLVLIRFLMMAGNWGQHAFIDASDPGNSLLNSITCINSGYNQRCFNDGYHIGHHVHPTMHWTDMPGDFLKAKDEYAKAGAIVFEGIDFFIVWFWLMLGRFDWLANRYVPLDDSQKTKDEIIALLKERTRPIPAI